MPKRVPNSSHTSSHHDRGENRNGRKPNEFGDRISGGAADDRQIEDDRLDDLAEREGGEREIDAARAQHRHRDDQRNDAGDDAGGRNGEQRGQLEDIAEIGRRVGADGGEAGKAEIELAGRKRQEAAIREHHVHGEQDQDAFQISAHTRACPAMLPANRPVGRTNKMNSSRP